MDFWAYLERIANVVGVLALIPLGFLITWGRKQLREAQNRRHPPSRTPNDHVGVLIINIFQPNIEAEVIEHMRQKHPELKLHKDKNEFYKDMFPVFNGYLSPDDMGKFLGELGKIKVELYEKGIRHVHLFIFGPQVFPLIIGDEFANNIGITYYSKDMKTKEYVCWGEI